MRVEKMNNQASFGMKFPYMQSQSWCLDEKAVASLRDLLARPDEYSFFVNRDYGKIFQVNEIWVRRSNDEALIYLKRVLPSKTHKIIDYLASNKFLFNAKRTEATIEAKDLKAQLSKIKRNELLKDCEAIKELEGS